ncbi:MAG TPA: NYN domain-containing protein [Ktedonobacterales bacterium]
MTQDQQDPTQQAPGTTENTAPGGAESGAPKAGTSRPARRRHTSSRSRKPKDQHEAKEQSGEQHGEQATVAPAAEVPATPAAQQTAADAVATAPAPVTETPKRPSTRGRRNANTRRRGKAETLDVQLLPNVTTVGAPETAGPADIEATEKPENPLVESFPAMEPLPLDAAILAHLDAMSQAAGHQAAPEQPSATAEPALESAAAPQEESPLPAPRRYRFDRPRSQPAAGQTGVRPERLSGWRATPPTLMTPPPSAQAETAPAEEEGQAEILTVPIESAEAASPETAAAPEAPEAPETPQAVEAVETPEAREEQAPAAAEETTEGEDQTERESASRRRRRRRGRGAHAQESETGEAEGEEQGGHEEPAPRQPTPYVVPETTVTYAHDRDLGNGYTSGAKGYEEAGYAPYTPAPRARTSRPSTPAAHYPESPWNMATAQGHVQEPESPFGSPEPSFAHGFGPQSAGVATPLHETTTRVRRGERAGEAPPMSANQLGTIITNAIAQQTDRLLSELRRQQNPPAMTVALPVFPSTERVGVFVDVANLLYSARSQRMSIDFGRLLDFLRGNRRLIRAHAYAPTNPDPHAEQTFLSAVKGVGYRITTKNYKTFASGARKADMDLDLCMDIVRLVDAGSLDTVVLVSGDSDFLPLLEYCSDRGVRVEVAAFDDAASMILRQSCDLFINLSQVEEIRV